MPSLEVFTNLPTGTVTAGGTTTTDTAFTVTPTNPFPVASSSAIPSTFFRIVDVANDSEIMWVTTAPGGSGSGQSWTVARAQEGTTAIDHAANWTCAQVITGGTLQNMRQTSGAAVSAVTVADSSSEIVVAVYDPLSSELVAGATFEAIAFGTYGTGGSTRPTLAWRLRWGGSGSVGSAYTAGTTLTELITGTNISTFSSTTVASGCSFDVSGTVTYISSTQATGQLNVWMNNPTLVSGLTGVSVNTGTGTTSSSTPITISGSGPIFLTAQWSAAETYDTLTAVAPLIARVA